MRNACGLDGPFVTAVEDESWERLAQLERLRWTIELDHRRLTGEFGLDHYEAAATSAYFGFHRYCALVTCVHAFLTLERLDPKARRPA